MNLSNILYILTANLSIVSAKFYVYLLLFTAVYYTVGRKFNIQWLLLLFASLFFYLANGKLLSLWIFVPVGITYISSLLLYKVKGKTHSLLSAFVIVFNVVFLIHFKESNFFIRLINYLLNALDKPLLAEVNRKAPFGISYIILMLISYYLDISWGVTKAQKNPLKYLSYIFFFPITSSGPIARYTQLKGSLFEIHKFNYEDFCLGCQRILWGFFKKFVIAERLAHIVANVYGNDDKVGFVVLIGLLSFSIQMYFDFSGCMDMVMGIAKILGIELPENFQQPFFSTSLSEFWRRWHITLGFWVRDYILYPVLKCELIQKLSSALKHRLGKKNRYAKLIPTWCGMFCVWFTVGFWHGGTWNYIFGSGLFFFFMIAIGQLLSPVFEKLIKILHINTQTLLWKTFQRLRTALLFATSVSFDRTGFKHCVNMWKRALYHLFTYSGGLFAGTTFKETAICYLVAIFIIFIIGGKEYKSNDNTILLKMIAKKNIIIRWVIYYALIYSILLLGIFSSGFNSANFIYMGF